MRFFVLALVLISLAFSKSVLVVVDASGSMEDLLSTGELKIDAAKTAAKNFIERSQGNEIGVMRFSYCSDTYDVPDPLDGDIRILQHFTTDKQALKDAVDSIQTGGDTPIAGALEESIEYFKSKNKRDGIIILLTDGEETCGGDPEQAAQLACQQGYAVVNVIGYNLSGEALESASKIAEAGCGKLYTAENQQELEQALAQASGSNCLPFFIFLAIASFIIVTNKKNSAN